MLIRESAKGILAGLCIALGGSVYLGCENRVAGAVLFSVALYAICVFGFTLYTGKVGNLIDSCGGKDLAALFTGLFGNTIGCLICGLLIRVGVPSLGASAENACAAKLTQGATETLVRAFFCGVLVYIAVRIFREKNTPLGIFVCIPAFILSGFEHSIADMFYFAAGKSFTWESLFFLVLVLVGNSVGSWVIPLLEKCTKERKTHG